MQSSTASAPGKAILLGEHAVVYGQPALAVPLTTLRTEVTLGPGSGRIVHRDGAAVVMAGRMLERAREILSVDPGPLDLQIDGNLPIGVGMGSSAALAVSILRSLSESLGFSIEPERLVELATEIERLAHGTPSGIDPAVVAGGRPILFRRRPSPADPEITTLELPEPFPLVVADTGVVSDTGQVVGDVRRLRDGEPERIDAILEAIGRIVESAAVALPAGDLETVGQLMNENQQHLETLTVSSPSLERIVVAARNAGALGAKLSGAGRGGIAVALTAPGSTTIVAEAMAAAGAARVLDLETR